MTQKIISVVLLIVVSTYALWVSAQEQSNGNSAPADSAKSIAWYVANLSEARAKNKECYDGPHAKDMQSSPDCANSLKALNISFTGGNQPISSR
jgi:hypothetical protein